MRITKTAVIETAAKIADQSGLDHVSLKKVAEILGIRTPSLYNHIGSLENLLQEVAQSGMQTMNDYLLKAAVGVTAAPALFSVSRAYLSYMLLHPGIYETIQWAVWHDNEKTLTLFEDYQNLLRTIILSCNLEQKYTEDILRLITGTLHGYTTLQLRYALQNPELAQKELAEAMDILLVGIYKKFSTLS